MNIFVKLSAFESDEEILLNVRTPTPWGVLPTESFCSQVPIPSRLWDTAQPVQDRSLLCSPHLHKGSCETESCILSASKVVDLKQRPWNIEALAFITVLCCLSGI